MKKILLFTSILFLTITTSLFAQAPTISNAFISQPILCNSAGVTSVSAGMQIVINQTAPPTGYSGIVGYYVGATYFVSYLSTNQTTAAVLNLTGFNPNVDYCIRIVDSVAYYNANPFGSGTSSSRSRCP